MTTKEFPTYSKYLFKNPFIVVEEKEGKEKRLGFVPNTYADFGLRRQSPTCLHGAH